MRSEFFSAVFALIAFSLCHAPPSFAGENSHSNWYKPPAGTSWQWQLTGTLALRYDVEVYDIDLEETPPGVIDALHRRGIKVICYFNGGAYEPYRSDSRKFPKETLGAAMEGWGDERWLDIEHFEKFAPVMEARLNLAVQKKCDGVEPDNMDGYQNKTGFPLTGKDQLRYNAWMAEQAHKRNLSIGLKNDLEQVKDLVDLFDFAVNEQCFEHRECDALAPFIAQNKAVFNAEYELALSEFCPEAQSRKISALKMTYELDGKRQACPGQ